VPALTIGSVDEQLLRLMHENLIRGVVSVRRSIPSGSTAEVGPWLLGDSGISDPDVNQAIVGAPVGDPDAAIRSASEWYGERQIPFSFLLRDSADATVVEAALAAGYVGTRFASGDAARGDPVISC